MREALLFEVGVQNIHTNGAILFSKISRMDDSLVIANVQMSFVMYNFSANKAIRHAPILA